MKPQDLRKLISQPESETLEFKARLPDARRVASLISAFANTNGGTLVVGVREGGEIVGVDHPEDARLRFEQANDLVTPSVDIQTETVRVDDKSVLIIRVPKGPAPPY